MINNKSDGNTNKSFNLSFQYIGEDDNENPISPDDKKAYEFLLDSLYKSNPNLKNTYSFNKNLSILDIFDDIYSEDPKMAISVYINLVLYLREYLKDYTVAYYIIEPFQEVFEPTPDFNMFDYLYETNDYKYINYLFAESSYFSDVLLENILKSKCINDDIFLEKFLNAIYINDLMDNNPESLSKEEIKYLLINHFKKENLNDKIDLINEIL